MLAEYLRHYVNEDQTNWDEWISYAMFTYNTAYSNYLHSVRIITWTSSYPTHSSLYTSKIAIYNIYDNYTQELKERLRTTQKLAKQHIQEAKQKVKEYADKTSKPSK